MNTSKDDSVLPELYLPAIHSLQDAASFSRRKIFNKFLPSAPFDFQYIIVIALCISVLLSLDFHCKNNFNAKGFSFDKTKTTKS